MSETGTFVGADTESKVEYILEGYEPIIEKIASCRERFSPLGTTTSLQNFLGTIV